METQQQDHDNIITLLANVKTLTEEVRLMRDDTKDQMKDLKANKLDAKEFNEFKIAHAKEMLVRDNDIERQLKEAAVERTSQGKKIDFILRVIFIGLGILGTIEFVAPLLLRYLLGV